MGRYVAGRLNVARPPHIPLHGLRRRRRGAARRRNGAPCPDRAGDPDPNPAKNGCPKIEVVKGEIRILERIEFDNGKDTLRPESEPLLMAIRHALIQHTEIKKVRLEGYTDSRGKAASNLKLSQRRVDTVMKWLIDHDIEAFRMVAQGFGKSNPIASNASADGRQRNRRVQIIILDQSDTPAPP